MDCIKITSGKLGTIWAVTCNDAICHISFRKPTKFLQRYQTITKSKKGARQEILESKKGARQEIFGDIIEGVIAGRLDPKTIPIAFLHGTPFQKLVWRAMFEIPYSSTVSYGWLATKIKRPGAVRAVANACGANPIPIIIPCHRVIASDGGIGGYSSGVHIKKKLLKLEGVCF